VTDAAPQGGGSGPAGWMTLRDFHSESAFLLKTNSPLNYKNSYDFMHQDDFAGPVKYITAIFGRSSAPKQGGSFHLFATSKSLKKEIGGRQECKSLSEKS
jgi:hypothetical protein